MQKIFNNKIFGMLLGFISLSLLGCHSLLNLQGELKKEAGVMKLANDPSESTEKTQVDKLLTTVIEENLNSDMPEFRFGSKRSYGNCFGC